jgi:hypothetical protein
MGASRKEMTMTHRKLAASRLWPVALGLGLVTGSALAHHGWGWYTQDGFTLTGTVVATHFGNPHDRLTVEADGQEWNVVLSPPSRSERAGFSEDQVKVGDTITATGVRHRDPDTYEMKTARIQVGDQTYDVYPDRIPDRVSSAR